MTIADRITQLAGMKAAQKAALEGQGRTPSDDWTTYAGEIAAIEGGGDPWVPPPPSDLTSAANLFHGWTWLETAPFFDTSNVTDMTYMFYNCGSLTSVPLFDTSSATDMTAMFGSCSALVEVPLFDTSSVTNMSSMFYDCGS
ncbi:MAG TPA: BspA family leucine-rich repeat surface protein, partial [Beutenbergiaceae bacterium]|nr:BspA family leucine-rich repeat surface protein [Beutenbergiaceae bacterium]